MATKIDTIKLGTSEYEIDLKSTATPTISSLTTSTLTVTGNSDLDTVIAAAINVGEIKLGIDGIRGPGVDVPISAESGDINLTASDGNININRTTNTSNPATGSITISNARGDITLSTYEGNINIYTSTSIPSSGGNITIGPATLDSNTVNQTIALRGYVAMQGINGSVTVSNGMVQANSLKAQHIYTSIIKYPNNNDNNAHGISLTSGNITLSSGNATGTSISIYGNYGVSISSSSAAVNIDASYINLSSTGSIQLYGGSSSINLSCTTGSIYLKTTGGKIVLSTSGTSASNTLTISKNINYGVSVSAGQGLYVTANKTNESGGLILDLSVSAGSPFYLKPTGVDYVTGTWLVLGVNNNVFPQLVYSGTSSSSPYLQNICQIRSSLEGNIIKIYLRSASNHTESQLVSMPYTNPSYYCYIKNAHLIRLT